MTREIKTELPYALQTGPGRFVYFKTRAEAETIANKKANKGKPCSKVQYRPGEAYRVELQK